MTSIKTAVLLVIQGGPLGRAKPCFGEKPVGALFIGIGYGCLVEPFRDKHGGFAFTRVLDGKGVVAQCTVSGPMANQGWIAVGKKLRAGREIRGSVTTARHSL